MKLQGKNWLTRRHEDTKTWRQSRVSCNIEKFGLQLRDGVEVGRTLAVAPASWTAAVPCRFRKGWDSRVSRELDHTTDMRTKRENASDCQSGRGLPQSKTLSRPSLSQAASASSVLRRIPWDSLLGQRPRLIWRRTFGAAKMEMSRFFFLRVFAPSCEFAVSDS